MNEPVKNALKITITLIVAALIVTTVVIVEIGKRNKRATTASAAVGRSVEIIGQPWNVIPFTTNNGNCYNLYQRGTWAFALPCVE